MKADLSHPGFSHKAQTRVDQSEDFVVNNTEKASAEWNDTYVRDWKLFVPGRTVGYNGRSYHGLALPGSVLRKIFDDNAVHWLPGIMGKQ